jgi:hypothetical protein
MTQFHANAAAKSDTLAAMLGTRGLRTPGSESPRRVLLQELGQRRPQQRTHPTNPSGTLAGGPVWSATKSIGRASVVQRLDLRSAILGAPRRPTTAFSLNLARTLSSVSQPADEVVAPADGAPR